MDWKNVADWITACLDDRGVPMFRLSYDPMHNKPAAVGVCWGGYNKVSSVRFINIPEEDLRTIELMTGEWRLFLEKYGGKEVEEKYTLVGAPEGKKGTEG